jgi:hypothetical protein
MRGEQNAGQHRNITAANKFRECVINVKYLATALTNQIARRKKKIKHRLNAANYENCNLSYCIMWWGILVSHNK